MSVQTQDPNNMHVLMLDTQEATATAAGTIFQFLGEQFEKRIDNGEGINYRTIDFTQVLCLLVGGQVDDWAQAQIQAVHEFTDEVPIVLCGDNSLTKVSFKTDIQRSIIGKVTMPPSYAMLMDTLHRAKIFRDQFTAVRGGKKRPSELFRSLVGTSRTILKVRELMSQVADKDVNVLITGESGTGKEVIARNLHFHSFRRHKPFVPVNCGAIPAELLESELFGHEKGSFTGAISDRPGRFELAKGGTLFLDEIGDMPLHMQVKILRVLQERTFERVGGRKEIKADVRIIAATHRNLEEEIEAGRFREDLFYRLNVFPIEMPPLRERTEDIPLLINELFVRNEKEKKVSIRLDPATLMNLCQYAWPGNVRELVNLIERLTILYPYDIITPAELPQKYRQCEALPQKAATHHNDQQTDAQAQAVGGGKARNQAAPVTASTLSGDALVNLPVNGLDLKKYLSQLESHLIQQALDDCEGVVARAAEKLHIRRTTLVEKMRKYEMQNNSKTG